MISRPSLAAESPVPVSAPLTEILDQRARETPSALAYRFLTDGEQEEETLSYEALREDALAMAGGLMRAGAAGKPVLLIEPPGLDFIKGLFACWYAGAIAVPAYPPRGNRQRERLQGIIRDSGAELAIGGKTGRALPGVTLLDASELGDGAPFDGIAEDHCLPCLLQYTSGSTSNPKGVMLSNQNLRHNLTATLKRYPEGVKSAVSWLPPYHDMGLVLKLLLAMEGGFPLTFFSPDHFVQRPVRWLRAISRYGADFSGGPNFAYELCLRSIRDEELDGLDLSSWKIAPCGAERVRPETLKRFHNRFAPYGLRCDVLLPGYGLAEATLAVTNAAIGEQPSVSEHPLAGRHVSCGPPIDGMSIHISDVHTGGALPEGEIGEIWIKGPSVASGYWRRPEESAAVFSPDEGLRTGDIGYMENGGLHVVGRLKDLIVLGGMNLVPDDIESVLAVSFPEITAAAAFALQTPMGDGVGIAIEAWGVSAELMESLCAGIRLRLAEALEIQVQRIVFVRAATLPRTTSGKVRRSATREALLEGRLSIVFDEARDELSVTDGPALRQVLDGVREVTGGKEARAGDDPIAFGLSSIEFTRLAAKMRAERGVQLTHAELFSATSFGQLAALIESKTAVPVGEIARSPDTNILSHSQERMWFLHQLDPESAAYHVFGALELEGPLDVAALGRAYQAVISRHRILRSRHSARDGRPQVRIEDAIIPELEISEAHPAAVEDSLQAFAMRPFDLAEASPLRALLVKRGENNHVLALCAHHIVADGWSIRVILRELTAFYASLREGKPARLPTEAPDYLDYAAWHRGWIDGGAADHEIAYWKDRLSGHQGVMELTTDFPRQPKASPTGGAIQREIPPRLVERIGRLAKTRRATPFMVQLAAFLLLLRRHGGGDDQVVAVPVANRNHAVTGEMIGTLVNTLPFRLSLDSSETFLSLLDRVRDAAFAMQGAQDAPFERIIEAVRPGRTRDRSPLAQVMFDHQEIPLSENWPGGLKCRPCLAHRGAVQFDLSLLLFVLPESQQAVIEYRSDLFSRQTAEAMLERYFALLEMICTDPAEGIWQFEALSQTDRLRLKGVSYGSFRPDFPIETTPALISGIVKAFPKNNAVFCGADGMDYAHLDARAGSLAMTLLEEGVKPGDRVALLLERDEYLPVAMLAVWKAGGAYVPLDAANPPERLALILKDQAPLTVLVSPSLTHLLPHSTMSIVMEPVMTKGPAAPLIEVSPEDPAYILYTSGSSGRPKGVVVSHGALANFLLSMREQPGFRVGERLLAVTTVSFDISALEILLPLISGGTVDLVPGKIARDGAALRKRLESTKPQVMQATPATWRMLIEAGWKGSPGLRILCGGEAMDLPLARQLSTLGSEAWNLYGPTETTVWSTLWKVPENPQHIRIGRPIANTGIHILAADGSRLPPGVPGDLFISGAGVAEGYWNRMELTAASFLTAVDGMRLYRTGDIVRWHADGTLECLGRTDGQVKIRGFRVELGEIDAALLSHPDVAEGAAVLSGDGRLVAWLRPREAEPDLSAITAHLRKRLPEYMVPAPLIVIPSLPLTASGKIDRNHLASRALPAAESRFILPASDPVEREVTAIWERILERGALSPQDDFFELGGHSLLAVRLVSEVSKGLGVTVALDWLFDQPTPAGMAAQIREKAAPDLREPRAIPLHQGNGGTPLFWIHTLIDGGMGLLPYREAARILGDVTDSFGIAEGTRAFGSLPEMAAAHIEVIRGVQPHGPYRIAGFCFGGNLAVEIASQLTTAGETVELLCLLESSPPYSDARAVDWLKPANWFRILSRLPGRASGMMQRDRAANMRRLRMKTRSAGTIVSGKKIPDIHGVLDLTGLDAETQERAATHWQALHLHEGSIPEVGHLAFVRAEQEAWIKRPADLGWQVRGEFNIHTVPGRHEEFLRRHSAREVSRVMRSILEAINSGESTANQWKMNS